MKNIRILVADDERIAADIIGAELTSEGYAADVVYSGSDAVCKLNHEKYDLLILDNRMPGKSGLEILEAVNGTKASQKVILMTAYATVNDAVSSMKLGAVDYIQKPFDNDQLISMVNRLFQDDYAETAEEHTVTEEDGQQLMGHSARFTEFYSKLMRVKDLITTVLLIGESGTGKSAVAKEMHLRSNRCKEPFVHVNCATLPPNLVESELFGHVKGAFTGAYSDKKGKFEQAGEGTLFLDEISTLPLDLQSKLLTVLQERQFEKIGGSKTIEFKARVISATNTNLAEEVKNGHFREDLFYRLNVITLECPPLRERKEDIEDLFYFFLERFKKLHERTIVSVDEALIQALIQQPWRGNIRELENTVERIVAMNTSGMLTIDDLRNDPFFEIQEIEKKPQSEYDRIVEALRLNNDHRERTAQYLGISRRTLQYKLKKYNLI